MKLKTPPNTLMKELKSLNIICKKEDIKSVRICKKFGMYWLEVDLTDDYHMTDIPKTKYFKIGKIITSLQGINKKPKPAKPRPITNSILELEI